MKKALFSLRFSLLVVMLILFSSRLCSQSVLDGFLSDVAISERSIENQVDKVDDGLSEAEPDELIETIPEIFNITGIVISFSSSFPEFRMIIKGVFGDKNWFSSKIIGNREGASVIAAPSSEDSGRTRISRTVTITSNGGTTTITRSGFSTDASDASTPKAATDSKVATNKNLTTDASKSNSVSDLKKQLKSKFGVDAVDGSSVWTANQLRELMELLEKLPEEFRGAVKTVRRDKAGNPGDLGATIWNGAETGTIRMFDNATHLAGQFQRVLTHEMTHSYQKKFSEKYQAWQDAFYQNGRANPPYSLNPGYPASRTDPKEDMAESVRDYVFNKLYGGELKAQHPERYNFIKKYIMNGVEF